MFWRWRGGVTNNGLPESQATHLRVAHADIGEGAAEIARGVQVRAGEVGKAGVQLVQQAVDIIAHFF